MKNLKNLIRFIFIVSSIPLRCQSTESSCNVYLENANIKYFDDYLEQKLIKNFDLKKSFITINTSGQINTIIIIEFDDTIVQTYQYKINNDEFHLTNEYTNLNTLKIDFESVNGFYQYESCERNTDNYSRVLGFYRGDKNIFRVIYEGVHYSYLPSISPFEEIIKFSNLYSKTCK